MGMGFTLRCRGCGYKISADFGVGFMFPFAHGEIMEKARTGKLGKTVKQFLEEHPDGALNTEKVLLQCTDCGALHCGPDLSMYVRNPDVPREEKEKWSVAVPAERAEYVSPSELKEGEAYQFYGYGNICRKCKKPMKPIRQEDLENHGGGSEEERLRTAVSCPKCREPLWIAGTSYWD